MQLLTYRSRESIGKMVLVTLSKCMSFVTNLKIIDGMAGVGFMVVGQLGLRSIDGGPSYVVLFVSSM